VRDKELRTCVLAGESVPGETLISPSKKTKNLDFKLIARKGYYALALAIALATTSLK